MNYFNEISMAERRAHFKAERRRFFKKVNKKIKKVAKGTKKMARKVAKKAKKMTRKVVKKVKKQLRLMINRATGPLPPCYPVLYTCVMCSYLSSTMIHEAVFGQKTFVLQ